MRNGIAPLLLLLTLDALNGLTSLLVEGLLSMPAAVAKILIIGYMLMYSRISLAVLILFLTLILLALLPVYYQGFSGATIDLWSKTASVALLFIVLIDYLEKVRPRAVELYLCVALLVIAVSFLSGLFGVGHIRYGEVREGFALKTNGFLIAGNEINAALLALFWWLAVRRRQASHDAAGPGRALLSYKGLYWLCLAAILISSSKTTILGALLIILYFGRGRVLSMLLGLVGVLTAAIIVYVTGLWHRWAFFYLLYADRGLLSAMTGGRTARIEDHPFRWPESLVEGVPILANGNGLIESDPLDLVYNLGLPGLLWYGLFLVLLFRIGRGGSYFPAVLLAVATVGAGHIVYSVFAAPIIACALYMAARPAPTAVQPHKI